MIKMATSNGGGRSRGDRESQKGEWNGGENWLRLLLVHGTNITHQLGGLLSAVYVITSLTAIYTSL